MNQLRQRCTTCLMPNTYPGIRFNKDSICNHCLEYEKPKLHGEELLSRKITSKRGNKYDCVVGISGGRDSCYMAYLAKERFSLRVLAVFYDSPFYCELSRNNIRNVCRALDLDLITIRSKNNLEYHLLRNHLISVAPTGTSWGQCIFCHYGIDAALFNVAKEKKIPFIFSGITSHEIWNPGNRTKILLKRLSRLSKNDLLRFLSYQAKAYGHLVDQRKQFGLPCNSIFNVYKRAKIPSDGVAVVPLFDYVEWNHEKIETVLTEGPGWVKPQKPLSWRYDCSLEALLDYTYKKEFGISTVGIYLSSLIRSGQIERKQALHIMEQCENRETLRHKVESVFNYLQIPQSVQDKFFTAP